MSLAFLIAITLIQLHQQFATAVPKTERVRECHFPCKARRGGPRPCPSMPPRAGCSDTMRIASPRLQPHRLQFGALSRPAAPGSGLPRWMRHKCLQRTSPRPARSHDHQRRTRHRDRPGRLSPWPSGPDHPEVDRRRSDTIGFSGRGLKAARLHCASRVDLGEDGEDEGLCLQKDLRNVGFGCNSRRP
jgi:hypothetical protein